MYHDMPEGVGPLSFVHQRIFGAVSGFIGGGPTGAIGGFIHGGGGGPRTPPRMGTPTPLAVGASGGCQPWEIRTRAFGGNPQGVCEPALGQNMGSGVNAPNLAHLNTGGGSLCVFPFVRQPDGSCRFDVDPGPGVGLPGGNGMGGGHAVSGAFGMPAIVPTQQARTRLSCPGGMVLGEDDLCYPRAVLRRDSKFRKWRPGPRPLLTGARKRNISRARTDVLKVKEIASSFGVTVPKKKC
jgi:hypothetical protein